MPITLDAHAIDQSTYVIVASFTDEEGDPVVPNEITWTLMDEAGNVVNSRAEVAVTVPDTSISIVLSGDDLDFAVSKHRVLLVEGDYDSRLGNSLPIRETLSFQIDDLMEALAPVVP